MTNVYVEFALMQISREGCAGPRQVKDCSLKIGFALSWMHVVHLGNVLQHIEIESLASALVSRILGWKVKSTGGTKVAWPRASLHTESIVLRLLTRPIWLPLKALHSSMNAMHILIYSVAGPSALEAERAPPRVCKYGSTIIFFSFLYSPRAAGFKWFWRLYNHQGCWPTSFHKSTCHDKSLSKIEFDGNFQVQSYGWSATVF